MRELLSLAGFVALILCVAAVPTLLNDHVVEKATEMANSKTPEPETASFVQEIDAAKSKPTYVLENGLYSNVVVDGEKKAVAEFYFTDGNHYTASLKMSMGNKTLFTASSDGTYEILGQAITFKPINGSLGLANGRYVLTELSSTAFTLQKNDSKDRYTK